MDDLIANEFAKQIKDPQLIREKDSESIVDSRKRQWIQSEDSQFSRYLTGMRGKDGR